MTGLITALLCVLVLAGASVYWLNKEKKEDKSSVAEPNTPKTEDDIHAFHMKQAEAPKKDVTDEKTVTKPIPGVKTEKHFESSIASVIIKVHAWICLAIGIIYGLVIIKDETGISLLIMYGSVVLCAILIGFSEIIDNTKAIRDNTDKKE